MSFILDYIIFYQNKRARIQKHVIYSDYIIFFNEKIVLAMKMKEQYI